jgi:UDP-N-acetylglucosamine/UDP-N-acetylgalactosamine diphosphorylase
VVCGSGSHVRGGTILEEHSSIAHTVGLKQTILLPYVTLGSLINFCDCLMAGGTSRENHSEVGSAYIHFNYTPNQDKATPSLIGDVPRGVMLNQHPIFLGGQGGLVGPCRIAYGTIIGAGSLCRKDQLDENRLVFEGCSGKGSLPFKAGVYRTIQRILHNNFYYLGNLIALHQWYRNVRARFVGSQMPAPLYQGLLATLDMAYEERIKQLLRLAGKMQDTAGQNVLQRKFKENSLLIEKKLRELYDSQGDQGLKKQFLEVLERNTQPSEPVYLETIHRLSIKEALIGTAWLDSIVRNMLENMIEILPTLKV